MTQIWQICIAYIYFAIASAAFTPTFQAMIPDVLPDEKEYTNALSLSRLAYDLENIISPMLAAFLLTLHQLSQFILGDSFRIYRFGTICRECQTPNG